jgi:mono/diheme cytochrome c family protein
MDFANAGPAQRARGSEHWSYDCAGCHGVEGEAGRAGPRRATSATVPQEPVVLTSERLARWGTASALFDRVRAHMPGDVAGQLSDRDYWDTIAFLLARHGTSLGDRALDADIAPSVRIHAASVGGE